MYDSWCSLLAAGNGTALGSVAVNSIPTFALKDGTIPLETLVATVAQVPPLPGEFAAVGLADGTDQNNAIEIVGFTSRGTVTCRNASNGLAKETAVTLTNQPFSSMFQYQIIAKPDVVKFYINGALVATHTSDIPKTSLDALFTVSAQDGSGLYVSTTSFRQRQK